jgi:glycosyltransferase involved in cell wall biosynthesis
MTLLTSIWNAPRFSRRKIRQQVRRPRKILFLQCTNAGNYPPIINAAKIFASNGWRVTILSSPSIETLDLGVGKHAGLIHLITRVRPTSQVQPLEYLNYILASIRLALRLRPNVIYASDPLGALPALSASKVSGAQIVYHEHDSPAPGSLRPFIAHMRARVARVSRVIIFPNEARSRIAKEELCFSDEELHIVWNLPRLGELPIVKSKPESPLIVYYHGHITPDRLPESVVGALHRFQGRIRLVIVGYEAPSAPGYIERIVSIGKLHNGPDLVRYAGQFARENLLDQATCAHVGLALMPFFSTNVNMCHITGASNKAFDYMAAGLALLVSDLPEWHEIFVKPGFAIACACHSEESLAAALGWFLDNVNERRSMAARNRAKIEKDWNYDTGFGGVLASLEAASSE